MCDNVNTSVAMLGFALHPPLIVVTLMVTNIYGGVINNYKPLVVFYRKCKTNHIWQTLFHISWDVTFCREYCSMRNYIMRSLI